MTGSEHVVDENSPIGEQRPPNWGYLHWQHGECYGEDEEIRIHMSYPGFLRHVEEYLREQGIVSPTNAQIINAGFLLSRVANWHKYNESSVEVIKKAP